MLAVETWSRHSGTSVLAFANVPSVSSRKPAVSVKSIGKSFNASGKVLTAFGLTPDHLDGIQFAMELR